MTSETLGGFRLNTVHCADCLEAAAKGLTLQEHRECQGALFGDDA